MKKIALVILIIAFFSCDSEERIKQEIKSKKGKIEKLKEEVKELESKLESDTGNVFLIPVDVKDVEYEDFNHYIEVYGNIEAKEHAQVSPEMNGQIRKIFIKEGKWVKKGQLLVSLNTDVTEANIKEIKTSLELADTMYRKQKRLFEDGIGSEVELLRAKSQKEQLAARLQATVSQMEMSKIYAPFSGIVDELFQKEGELASLGMPILQMVDLNRMKIVADISEAYIPAIHEGKTVELSFPTYPDISLDVKINRTGNVINPANRTFQVECEFDNVGKKFKPNMLGTLKIGDYSMDSALVVPSIIIKKDIAKKGISDKFLFVAEKNNGHYEARKVYVKPGRSYNGKTVITKGLEPGQRVVIKGYNTVSTGALVKF